jgi:hypothetical protein
MLLLLQMVEAVVAAAAAAVDSQGALHLLITGAGTLVGLVDAQSMQ